MQDEVKLQDGNEMLRLIDHSSYQTVESTKNDVIIHSGRHEIQSSKEKSPNRDEGSKF